MFPSSVVLACLEPLQRRDVCHRLGFDKPPLAQTPFALEQCKVVWYYALLEKINFMAFDERERLLDASLDDVVRDSDAPPMLVFYDKHLAVWTGRRKLLDLRTGAYVEKPLPSLETIGYDLVELWRRSTDACRKRQETPDADDVPTPGPGRTQGPHRRG